MKYFFVFFMMVLTASESHSQVSLIDQYCDSIDIMIAGENSFGYRAYYVQSINLERNVRAIGLQKTSITIYYEQPEDSVYDDGKKVEFIPKYIPPFKIRAEYNIASSQIVRTEYFLNVKGELMMYRYITRGAFTCGVEKFYFSKNKLFYVEKNVADSCITPDGSIVDTNTSYFDKYEVYKRSKNFTKEDKEDAEDILENLKEYLELYYSLFEIEQLEKD